MSMIVQVDATASGVGTDYESWLRSATDRVSALDGFSEARVLTQLPSDKPVVIFVLGGPGAGKGTQCALMEEHFGFTHISAGDCLRAERASGSKDADLINNYIREGQIVPVEITVKLLQKAMKTSGNSKFLIDGFPRNVDNLSGWNRVVGSSAEVAFCMFFDCPESVMERRLLKRGETSGRADDNIESIKKRFRTYVESTMPIIHRFEAMGKLRHIAADAEPEVVFKDVTRVIEALDASRPPATSRFSAQFEVSSPAAYEAYRRTLGPTLQTEAQSKFGDNVSVQTRRFTVSGAAAVSGASGKCTATGACFLSKLKSPVVLGALFVGVALGVTSKTKWFQRSICRMNV